MWNNEIKERMRYLKEGWLMNDLIKNKGMKEVVKGKVEGGRNEVEGNEKGKRDN